MEFWGGAPIPIPARGLQLGGRCTEQEQRKNPHSLFSPAQNYNLRAEFVNGERRRRRGGDVGRFNAQILVAPRN